MFAPDGKTILAGDAAGALHEWSLETKKEVKAVRAPGAVTAIVFAPGGAGLAAIHASPGEAAAYASPTAYSVVFWGPDRAVLETKKGWSSVAFSKDGKRMAIGGKRVDFLDPSSRALVRTVELPAITMRESNPAFASDPSADTKIPVSVVALAFSPDGTTLAAGCMDGSIRLIPVAP